MAPWWLLNGVALISGKPTPPYTQDILKFRQYCDEHKLLPVITAEMMRSCETYLIWWWLLLFCMLLILPWRKGKEKHENIDHRNKNLLKIMTSLSLFLVIGIVYHLLLDFGCTLYETEKDSVTSYDKLLFWGNQTLNWELPKTMVYGVRDYGTLKQEPIARFLFFGILLVIVSWCFISFKIIGMAKICFWEFCIFGIGGPFYICSWFVKHWDIFLLVLSELIPWVEFFLDPMVAWAYRSNQQTAT